MTKENKWHMKGIFLSLDSIAAMLLLFIVVLVAFSYTWAPKSATYESLSIRAIAQDAATVMGKMGYLSSPIDAANGSGTEGISSVLAALPASYCVQVAAFGSTITDGLEGYWKLNDAFGSSATDSSGNAFAAVLKGNADFSETGISGSSVSFDGDDSSQLDSVQSAKLEPSRLTVSAWVKPSANGQVAALVERSGGYRLGLDTNSTPSFWINVGGSESKISSPRSIPAGKWAHLVGTFDNSTRNLSIYVDGNLTNSAINAGGIVYGPPSGGKTEAVAFASDPFTGELDEIRIYGRALGIVEVWELYSNKENLLYLVEMPGCLYSGGEIQTVIIPFAHNSNQDENKYYHAVLKAWVRGTRQ